MTKLYWVTYDPENGDVVPDAKIRQYVDDFIDGPTRNCCIGAATMIDEFRMQVVRGRVEGGQIRVGTPGGEFHAINEYAVLNPWPDESNLVRVDRNTSDLMIFAMNKRRHERELNPLEHKNNKGV
jgi:hypothetical protein